LVEKFAASFGVQFPGRELLASLTQFCYPGFVFRAKLLFQFAAESLGKRRAVAVRGDCDLQIATVYDSRVVEIAIGRIVHGVAKYIAQARLSEDLSVYFVPRGGGDYERNLVKVRGLKGSRLPGKHTFPYPFLNLPDGLGRDNLDGGASLKQALDLAFCNPARTYYQAAPAFEF